MGRDVFVVLIGNDDEVPTVARPPAGTDKRGGAFCCAHDIIRIGLNGGISLSCDHKAKGTAIVRRSMIVHGDLHAIAVGPSVT
jgi:hypothetical protein